MPAVAANAAAVLHDGGPKAWVIVPPAAAAPPHPVRGFTRPSRLQRSTHHGCGARSRHPVRPAGDTARGDRDDGEEGAASGRSGCCAGRSGRGGGGRDGNAVTWSE